MKSLELLIVEDNLKHLADAKSVCRRYRNINFTFAGTLEEAERLVSKNTYDAAVIDVFFPAKAGEEPKNAGFDLAKIVDGKGTPFVYNTSGNHHGGKYQDFLDKSRNVWNNGGFGIGKMIEAYPQDANAEKDTKQWWAAINYAILLAKSSEMSEEIKSGIGDVLHFAPYGDYGELTKKMEAVLLKEKLELEPICGNPEVNSFVKQAHQYNEAKKFIWKTLNEEYKKTSNEGYKNSYEVEKIKNKECKKSHGTEEIKRPIDRLEELFSEFEKKLVPADCIAIREVCSAVREKPAEIVLFIAQNHLRYLKNIAEHHSYYSSNPESQRLINLAIKFIEEI